APARTRLAPVQAVETSHQPCRLPASTTTARPVGQRYPVYQAGGEQDIQLGPPGEIQEPTPLELQPVESIEEVPPQPSRSYVAPSRPRTMTSNLQPRKADASPDLKCPTREELMKPICELGVDIAPAKGEVPKECPMLADGSAGRCWCDSLYMWKASS